MKVLCVAAHPDDEALGAGGTLAKHAAEGDEVEVFLVSDGAMARYEQETETAMERRAERRAEAETAADILGVSNLTVLDYWGNQLDDVALIDIVRDVESKIDSFQPNVIYTHHYGDLNIDHELVARAVRTAARPTTDSPVDRILSFETLSATEWGMPSADNAFQPTTFVDIDEYLTQKMNAINAYESEMRDRPHPRNPDGIRNNAKVWGDKSGLLAAEPFELLLERR
ncbi:PIG-L deacetylase family protein [Natrinema halophilum]|uniref:PIG-L family deacetylase n=1 Tax=Natrinema halophilum TaxID=1699371 RepID=A0A7D5GL24_9EURY|nr:PIG-L deacetylase family protein [Natrinema halophilum]QLG47413.1 PIG-L family deacetylase [Natrinema halophilum]